MSQKIVTGVWGDVRKWWSYDHADQKAYRGMRQDVTPVLEDVKQRAQAAPGRLSRSREHEYAGSIPRAMLDDWLRARGKRWEDYGQDRDLRRAFLLFMTAERPHFFAKNWKV